MLTVQSFCVYYLGLGLSRGILDITYDLNSMSSDGPIATIMNKDGKLSMIQ